MWSKDTPLHKAGLILKERENPHSEQAIGYFGAKRLLGSQLQLGNSPHCPDGGESEALCSSFTSGLIPYSP